MDEKKTSVKIQLPNIFKDHHIVAKKICNSHGKYKPELNEYFHMYRCQLNFAMFCVTSALGISWQHLNHPNLLVRAVYRFHVYFHIRLIFHELGISLPHEDGFSKVKNDYDYRVYCIACGQYGVNPDETWMYGEWFYTTDYGILVDNLTRRITTQSKGFARKGIEKISRSVMAYVYLVLSSQFRQGQL